MSLAASDLAGAWDLEEFVIRFQSDREPVFPFGKDAHGQLLYAGGRMSAVLSRADRAPLGVASLETAGLATVDAKAAAFSSYLSYTGSYRVEGTQVVHEVALSLVPESCGTNHVRTVSLDGERLVLSYQVTSSSGVVRDHVLTWRRSPAHG